MFQVAVTGDRALAYQAYRAVVDALVELGEQTTVHQAQPSEDAVTLSTLGADSGQLAEPTSKYLVELAVIAETIAAQLREQAAVVSGDL